MRNLILRMQLTLDGVAASVDGKPIDGVDHGDDDSWRDTFATLGSVDTMLLGAGMHAEYLDYWKSVLTDANAKPNEKKFAERAARTPHFVLSRSLSGSLRWPNAQILEGGVEGIAALKAAPGGDIMMWGGPTAAAAVIEAELFDEFHVETHPIIAGQGKKLFDRVGMPHRARRLTVDAFPSGLTVVKYAHS